MKLIRVFPLKADLSALHCVKFPFPFPYKNYNLGKISWSDTKGTAEDDLGQGYESAIQSSFFPNQVILGNRAPNPETR